MSLLEADSEGIALQVTQSFNNLEATELSIKVSEILRILPGRREVYAATLQAEGRSVVAKRFLEHPKQSRDWRREWGNLLQLAALNLSAPTPLCVAEEVDSTAVWVIMDRIQGAGLVVDGFEFGDRDERHELARQLACLVDAAHRAGVRQGDQHVNNWAWDGCRLFLLDAGSVEFSRHTLKERLRLQDLAGICVTLAPAAERLFREAIRTQYLIGEELLKGRILYELDEAIVALQAERTRRYFKKSRRTCTEFVQSETKEYRSIYLQKADPELVEAFLKDPEVLMAEGERLKSGNTCTVQGFSRGGRKYVLKRYNKQPLVDRLRKVFSNSRALKSWSSSWILEMAFIPTGRAVAVYEDIRECLPGLRYLLMERIEGQLLPEYIRACGADISRIDMVGDAFAQIWESLGRLRAVHGDLKATNLIVGEDGRLYLFDLDSFRFALKPSAFARGRDKDLRRFMQNWAEQPELIELFESKLCKLGE